MPSTEEFIRFTGSPNDFPNYGYNLDQIVDQLKGTWWKPSKVSNSFDVIEFEAIDLSLDLETFKDLAGSIGFSVANREEALALLGSGKDLSALHRRIIEFQFRSFFSKFGYQDVFMDSSGESWHIKKGRFMYLDNFAEEEGDLLYHGIRLINMTKASEYTLDVLSNLPQGCSELLCDNLAVAGIEDVISRDQAEVWTILGQLEPDEYDYEEDSHTETVEKAPSILAAELRAGLESSHTEFEYLIHLNRGYLSFWNLLLDAEIPSTLDEYSDALQRILEEIS